MAVKRKRIGILTGGGDAPGLNSIIESSVRTLTAHGCEVIGICDGFEGIFNGRTMDLTHERMVGAHSLAGTMLGTSNKSGTEGREKEFQEKYTSLRLDGLIAA